MANKVCDSYCLNCIYCLGFCDVTWCCNYYLMTDKRRPCPSGKGCTVRVERKRKRTKKWRDKNG